MTAYYRLKRLFFGIFIFLWLGLLYAMWVNFTGLGIPCMFRLITGFKCPGCGATSLCLALLNLDFKGAWEANAMLFLSLPILAALFVRLSFRYVKTGSASLSKGESVLCGILIALFLIWGVWRNI